VSAAETCSEDTCRIGHGVAGGGNHADALFLIATGTRRDDAPASFVTTYGK
jgi:hypothetical protein